MIKKVTLLPNIPVKAMSLARIYAQDKAFSRSPLENDFWVQEADGKITAVISSDGGSMNIYADSADYGELREFISALCPTQIFTEYKNAEPLGLKCDRVRNMLTYKPQKTADCSMDFSLHTLYDRLSYGNDVDIHLPSFEIFAPDVSHRLRHGGAVAKVSEYGAALAFTYDGGAVMSGIALAREFRGQGLGRKLLCELLSLTDGDFFVAANEENTKFYLKNGFVIRDKICFGKQEI